MAARERVGDWAEKTSATILLAAAVLGLVYEALHIFGGEELDRRLGSGEGALIFLVSLLCGGLGLERLLVLHKVRATIEDAREAQIGLISNVQSISTTVTEIKPRMGEVGERIPVLIDEVRTISTTVAGIERRQIEELHALRKLNQAESLIGAKDIEDAAGSLIDLCDDSDTIMATIQSRDRDPLSEQYDKTLVGRVLRAKQNKGNMVYHLLVPGGPGSGAGSAEERKRLFQEANIGDRLVISRAKQQWPFEVLIGGGTMIIALVGGTYEVAVQVTDPDFVEKASEWYKDIEWGGADRES